MSRMVRCFPEEVVMTIENYDVAVIGGGPGGYAAAGRAAQLGMKTVLVERDRLGGICLNWGCIPTKALLESAHTLDVLKMAGKFGLEPVEHRFEFPKIIERSRKIADRMSKGIGFLMKQRNVTVVKGTGRLSGPGQIDVETADGPLMLSATHIILATGSRPASIPGIEFDGDKILNSTDAMLLEEPPETLIVIGAGPIGMEFADFYRAFGTRVTVVEMMPQVLPMEDAGIVKELNRSIRRKKITVLTETRVTGVQVDAEGVEVTASGPRGETCLKADTILLAAGVRPNIESIGLDAAGVEIERGFVRVDDHLWTGVKGLFAIGDLTGPPMLAHKASMEAVMCINGIADPLSFEPVDPDQIPGCTYCHPQVASVGLTEARAEARGISVVTGEFPFRASGRSIAMEETEGLVKLVFDAANMKLVGAHILHAGASELIAEAGLALKMKATARDLAGTVHAHPTLSEAVMEAAAAALGEAVHI
jgi:dihydrolipoyl dehydrogenase